MSGARAVCASKGVLGREGKEQEAGQRRSPREALEVLVSSRLCLLCDRAGFSVWLSLSFPISKMGITIAPTWLGCLRAKDLEGWGGTQQGTQQVSLLWLVLGDRSPW